MNPQNEVVMSDAARILGCFQLPGSACATASRVNFIRKSAGTGVLFFVNVMTVALVAGIAGCSSESDQAARVPEVPVVDQQPTDSGTGGSGPAGGRRSYEGISVEIPADWQLDSTARMVDSKYRAATPVGEVEITLTTMGGGIDQNLDRWIQQVQMEPGDQPTWSTTEVAGMESRMVDVRGTFATGPTQGIGDTTSRDNWRLIGVAVPLPREFYIKAIGPRDAINAIQPDLTALLKSARIRD